MVKRIFSTATITRGRIRPIRLLGVRCLATPSNPPNGSKVSTGAASFQVFDRKLKQIQRDKAAVNVEESRIVDYLRDEVANRLVDRLSFINRTFPEVLDIGAGACYIARALSSPKEPAEDEPPTTGLPLHDRITRLASLELSHSLLHRDELESKFRVERIHADEESALLHPPESGGHFANDSFDAVLSSGSMHWINDLPVVLSGVNRVLKPDGPFIAAMLGGDSLYELRTSLQLVDLERLGGVSPHVSPLADIRDMGGLLQRAGFKLLTIDCDDIVCEYPDVYELMKDLGKMGEGSAILGRKHGGLGKEVLEGVDGVYREMFGEWGGSLPATFRIIYLIGWKASPLQPKPLARGSGETNLKDIL